MTLTAHPAVTRPLALVLGLALAGLAQASEDEVKKSMEAFIGSPAVETVTRTP